MDLEDGLKCLPFREDLDNDIRYKLNYVNRDKK